MTSRTTALRYPEGTKTVGTANVREDRAPRPGYAQKKLAEKFGLAPVPAFDDIADGVGAPAIALSIAGSARTAAQIGSPTPLGKTFASLTKPVKPSKYRNTKCESGGIKFDSKREMHRWHELVQMQVRGEISELELQVPFILADGVVIAGRKRPPLRYVADFVYEQGGETVVEDVKGRVTEGYRIKRHLMAARGIQIREVK
ncbi:DUF1064 domain-containing protein [Paraburkholderia bryophila]|uniref:Uncharacterized protein n=1 Tax=Paraburkholderia bryophila TaxID=420952 RepID=A0A7Z0B4Y9_9BURK|nr:DUF1064 domain-containing protein [Paraburkholderia bryophila]NYH21409.1 hypothetical protein [Paraburkholderia bryophila]